MTEKITFEEALDNDEFEVEPDEQKHRLRGRISKLDRDALKKLVTMTIKVYEPYVDQDNEQRDNYEDFVIIFNNNYGNFANAEGVNILNQCELGIKVECRYKQKSYWSGVTIKKMNIGTYLRIIDKRFIPAKLRKAKQKKIEKLENELKEKYKQKPKKKFGFEE
jgi:hypothetical protein